LAATPSGSLAAPWTTALICMWLAATPTAKASTAHLTGTVHWDRMLRDHRLPQPHRLLSNNHNEREQCVELQPMLLCDACRGWVVQLQEPGPYRRPWVHQ
jgi:hypothetical protein